MASLAVTPANGWASREQLAALASRAQDVGMGGLPSGTATFLFSDVGGSAQLLERHWAAVGGALARLQRCEQVVERRDEAIFEQVADAVDAAVAQRALAVEDQGPFDTAAQNALHTASVERRGDHDFGRTLFWVARSGVLRWSARPLARQEAGAGL